MMIIDSPFLMTSLIKIYDEFVLRQCKTICFTSSIPKEGTTTIASATAKIAASLNKKVLYCDFSDYATSLSLLLKKNFRTTPNEYLEQIYENIYFIDSLGFFLMPPPIPLIPTLFQQGFLTTLLEQLKKDYDLIIIDSNYYHSFTEGVILTHDLVKAADATILVALSGGVSQSKVKLTADSIVHDGGKLIGLILNDVNYPRLKDEFCHIITHCLDDKFPKAAEGLRQWIQRSDFFNTEN